MEGLQVCLGHDLGEADADSSKVRHTSTHKEATCKSQSTLDRAYAAKGVQNIDLVTTGITAAAQN